MKLFRYNLGPLNIILLGLIVWLLHLFSLYVSSGRWYFTNTNVLKYPVDAFTYFIPSCNLIYNGEYVLNTSENYLNRMPEEVRRLIEAIDTTDLSCLPYVGYMPGYALVYGLEILLVDLFNLSKENFLYLDLTIRNLMCLFSFLAILLIGYDISSRFDGKKRYLILATAVLLPPYFYLIASELYFLSAYFSIFFLLRHQSTEKDYYFLASIALAILSYFSKPRLFALVFAVPLSCLLLFPRRFAFYLGWTLFLWLPPQLWWSYHVYRHTSDWVLVLPRSVLTSATSQVEPEECWNPKKAYNLVNVHLIEDFIHFFGLPHDLILDSDTSYFRFLSNYPPKSLFRCSQCPTCKELRYYSALDSCIIPSFIMNDPYLYSVFKNIHNKVYLYFFSDSLPTSERIAHGKEAAALMQLLRKETESRYSWVWIYRSVRVTVENIFRLFTPTILSENQKSNRSLFARIQKYYIIYTDLYNMISFVSGIFALAFSSFFLYAADPEKRQRMRAVFSLSICGLSTVAVPVLVGASEILYFFIAAPILCIAGTAMLIDIAQSIANGKKASK